jgi:hypothetical protein
MTIPIAMSTPKGSMKMAHNCGSRRKTHESNMKNRTAAVRNTINNGGASRSADTTVILPVGSHRLQEKYEITFPHPSTPSRYL